MLSADSRGYVDFNKADRVEEAYSVGHVATPHYYNQHVMQHKPTGEVRSSRKASGEEDYLDMNTKPDVENLYYNDVNKLLTQQR